MSVYLKPCRGCPLRNGCAQRDDFRKRVTGPGLRSATFDCKRLTSAIEPGIRIVVRHPIKVENGGDYGPEHYIDWADVPATITSSGRDDFSCVIDRDALLSAIDELGGDATNVDTFRFRKTMKAYRIIRFLDEPRRSLSACGRTKLPNGSCDLKEAEDCCKAVFPQTEAA